MRVPAVDRPLDEAEWRAFVGACGFGHLVAAGRDRELPVVAPTQFVLDADQVLAHLARGNPFLDAVAEQPRALLAVAGDWAFVPSSWKAIEGEDPRLGIPTTYYAAVQLTGTVELVADPEPLAALLRRQLGALQPEVDVADPAVHGARLEAICGVVLHVDDVAARFKYGGNVDEAHRRQVLARLEARGRPGDESAAAHLRRRVLGDERRGSFRRG